MIGKILAALIVCALVVFGVVWVMSGGLSRAIQYAKTISNPLDFIMGDASGEPFRLPGQPDLMNGAELDVGIGSDLENAIYETDLGGTGESLPSDPQTFGNPSPDHGSISLAYGDSTSAPSAQYVVLQASSANAAPLSLSGWSLQSAQSGMRVALPPATELFVQGAVNTVKNVVLAPGDSAIVAAGFSPVGVSFKENRCAGYLAQFQEFTPPLVTRCPSATSIIGDTPENRAALGDACFSFMLTLRACQYPRSFPSDTSPACRSALSDVLSYPSCVRRHAGEADFSNGAWRLFLGASRAPWLAHDTIRLLDEKGQVVDTLTY